MAETFEYAVVGLGALGSATAWQLARRGQRVLGLERFELGHERGASHDSSRIIRHSYHRPDYVRLTLETYRDWATLEADTGEQLVTVTGGVDLFPPGAAIPAVDYTASMNEVSVPYEVLDTVAADRAAGRHHDGLPAADRDGARRAQRRGDAAPRGGARSGPA